MGFFGFTKHFFCFVFIIVLMQIFISQLLVLELPYSNNP